MEKTAKKLAEMIPEYSKILQYDEADQKSKPVSKVEILKQLEADHPSRIYSIDTMGTMLIIGHPGTEGEWYDK